MSVWAFVGVFVASVVVDQLLGRWLGKVRRSLIWLVYGLACLSWYGYQHLWGWVVFFGLFCLLMIVAFRADAREEVR